MPRSPYSDGSSLNSRPEPPTEELHSPDLKYLTARPQAGLNWPISVDQSQEFVAMVVRLRPFPADSAEVVSGWAGTGEEVTMWCGGPAAPVPAGQINAWAGEDGV